jgi:hypothetical protein
MYIFVETAYFELERFEKSDHVWNKFPYRI